MNRIIEINETAIKSEKKAAHIPAVSHLSYASKEFLQVSVKSNAIRSVKLSRESLNVIVLLTVFILYIFFSSEKKEVNCNVELGVQPLLSILRADISLNGFDRMAMHLPSMYFNEPVC